MAKPGDKAAYVDKVKSQMMQVMGISDPVEFQRMAREYCKDMALELCLPYYDRIFFRIGKVIEKTKDKFAKLTTNEEKLSYVMRAAMEDEETVDTFKMAFDEADPDMADVTSETSSLKRTEGNAAFQKMQDLAALKLYTEAAFTADTTTEDGRKEAATALANRSAVLYRLKKYKECLEDIEASILFNYPQNTRYKLIDRQAKCHAAMGQGQEAIQSFNRAILLLKQSNLDPQKQEVWKKEITAEVEKAKKMPEAKPGKDTNVNLGSKLLKSPNKKIPQFSDAVELTYNKHLGRFGKATRDIEVGEVIMVDTSLSCNIAASARKTNCADCAKKLTDTNGYPYIDGVGLRFCSVSCLRRAMESYGPVEGKVNLHKFFFNRKDKVYQDRYQTIQLAYRSITQKSQDFWSQFEDFDNVDEKFGVEFKSNEDLCHYSDYRNIFNLTGHRDKRSKDEILSLWIKSAIFIVLLRYGGYFGEKETHYGVGLSKSECLVGRIACHFMEGIQYNLHVIDEAAVNLNSLSPPTLTEVGCALFPTLLLLNHSCEQNTLRINMNGNQVLMVAKRSIKKSEEVTDNYGIHHISLTFEERQEKLQEGFAFSCCCDACSKDYPRLKSLRYQLPEDLEDEMDNIRDDIKEKFRKNNQDEVYSLGKKMIQLLEKKLIPYPHRVYESAAQCLVLSMWAQYGNRSL